MSAEEPLEPPEDSIDTRTAEILHGIANAALQRSRVQADIHDGEITDEEANAILRVVKAGLKDRSSRVRFWRTAVAAGKKLGLPMATGGIG